MQKVMCYGKIQEFEDSVKALQFYSECYDACDPESSEASRYAKIVFGLIHNITHDLTGLVTDEMED